MPTILEIIGGAITAFFALFVLIQVVLILAPMSPQLASVFYLLAGITIVVVILMIASQINDKFQIF